MSEARTDSGHSARAPVVLRVEIESLGDELSSVLARELAASSPRPSEDAAELAARQAELATAESQLLEREASVAREAARLREEELRRSEERRSEHELMRRCEELEQTLAEREVELESARNAPPPPERRTRRASDVEALEGRLSDLDERETALDQREAEREADLMLREDRAEDRERELTALEQRLVRKERELTTYVGQVQAALVGREPDWWNRVPGPRDPIKH